MFPLFYVDPDTKRTSFKPQKGYFPVVHNTSSQGTQYVVQLENNLHQPLEDRDWVVKTFRQMIFLDQCYWM